MNRLSYKIRNYFLYRKINNLLGDSKGLHIGCGSRIVADWINIDSLKDPSLTMKQKNNLLLKPNFIMCDITKYWPFPNNSISFIYSSHVIEHLTRHDALVFLTNCFHSLRKGGILRLSCPDLHIWALKYIKNDRKFFMNFYKNNPSFPELRTMADIFSGQFYGWDHKWMYDSNSLKLLLESAGFTKTLRLKFEKSSIPEIRKLEPIERHNESLYIEATC